MKTLEFCEKQLNEKGNGKRLENHLLRHAHRVKKKGRERERELDNFQQHSFRRTHFNYVIEEEQSIVFHLWIRIEVERHDKNGNRI